MGISGTAPGLGRDADRGTYSVLGWPAVCFHSFHRAELPRRLEGGLGERVAWDVAGKAPFALCMPDGSAYSYVEDRGEVRIVPGVSADAELVVELESGAWQDYLYELRTSHGLLESNSVRFLRGEFADWDAWEPAIRCMYSGTPIYRPQTLDLRDLADRPLDLHREFTNADEPDEMAHFLRSTGYLVVRRVFAPDRVEELAGEVDRIRGLSRDGERGSLWAEDDDGRRSPYRLTYLGMRSPRIAALADDPTVRMLCGLAGQDVVAVTDRDSGQIAVLNERRTTSGPVSIPNLPWHKDCALGGCPITCPRVHVGIRLDAVTQESAQLYALAGSWGTVAHDRFTRQEWDALPVVGITTQPGDVTVHMGCGLHAGPATTGAPFRRTLYVQFDNPRIFDVTNEYETYDQTIPGCGRGTRNLLAMSSR
ncbi:phytanoyl-CoA dioxygenase family protein [Streptomyces sp. SID3343]|uniref:phytanoyl-CoA dioxygenase family protein n=1 Tax=Streptomyces sp. SID3343 TaxID=2690260 RepID=UPI00136FE26A|nr:phytanoyl-CoA dioxygenase family protein [Streptomyces sp. SID3343]MYW00877.1 hypothetical protein [Streptomyces sp. SID3343]